MRKISQSAAVHYRLAILEGGHEVLSVPRKRNLILDQGLNGIASRTWADSFSHAAVGTGTTPTKRDSSAITFTRAGNMVTASAGFFEASDVGRILKLDTGEEMYILVFNSATEVEVNTSGALSASEGTVWYVNQTALTAEVKRTNTYSTDGGANGSTWDGVSGTWTMKRTFIFSAEVATVNYREIGWSHTGSGGSNLFGRDLLAGSGVVLVAGQQLKVEVELTVALSPASPEVYANVITGWTQDGQHGIEDCRIGRVKADGSNEGGRLDPSTGNFQWSMVPASTALRASADPTDCDIPGANIATINLTGQAYVAGSFTRNYVGTFDVNQGNRSDWRSMGIGGNPGGGQFRTVYRVLLDAAETKDSDHSLTITFALSWGRDLQN